MRPSGGAMRGQCDSVDLLQDLVRVGRERYFAEAGRQRFAKGRMADRHAGPIARAVDFAP